MTDPALNVYAVVTACGCPDRAESFTDDDGLAHARAHNLLCGDCWEWLTVISARTATEQERRDNPLCPDCDGPCYIRHAR